MVTIGTHWTFTMNLSWVEDHFGKPVDQTLISLWTGDIAKHFPEDLLAAAYDAETNIFAVHFKRKKAADECDQDFNGVKRRILS